jgi:hypothetical protein
LTIAATLDFYPPSSEKIRTSAGKIFLIFTF